MFYDLSKNLQKLSRDVYKIFRISLVSLWKWMKRETHCAFCAQKWINNVSWIFSMLWWKAKCENPQTLSALIPEGWGSWKDMLLGLFGPNIRVTLGFLSGSPSVQHFGQKGLSISETCFTPIPFLFLDRLSTTKVELVYNHIYSSFCF